MLLLCFVVCGVQAADYIGVAVVHVVDTLKGKGELDEFVEFPSQCDAGSVLR